MRYTVGVDDSGTGNRLLDGWAYLGIPQPSLAAFERDANAILLASKPKLSGFHGKEARKRDQDAFRSFLTLIKTILLSDGFCWFVLSDKNWNGEMNASAVRVVTAALKQQQITDESFISKVPPLAPCLASIAKHSVTLPAKSSLHLHFASDDTTRRLENSSTMVRSTNFPATKALHAYYRAFRQKFYPSASAIDQILFIQAKESIMVQAADVIAHFALAYLFTTKGHASDTKKWKAKMFGEVFNEIDASKVIDALTVVDDDLILNPSGMIVLDMELIVSDESTKPELE